MIDTSSIYALPRHRMDETPVGAADVQERANILRKVLDRPTVVPTEPIDDRHCEVVVTRVVPRGVRGHRRIPKLECADGAFTQLERVPALDGKLLERAVAHRACLCLRHASIVSWTC